MFFLTKATATQTTPIAQRPRILQVITGLNAGGAEIMLYKLLSQLNREKYDLEVISLITAGPIAEKIQQLGIPVTCLQMQRGRISLRDLFRLLREFRRRRPALVQTWMYHANVLGSLTKLVQRCPVVWNIRCGRMEPQFADRKTIWTARLGTPLSYLFPSRIICGSVTAWRDHRDLGYDSNRMLVVPNGFDLERFQPDPNAQASLRQELALPASSKVVGLFTRFDPTKDIENFVQTAALLRKEEPTTRFVMCGVGIEKENRPLWDWIREKGLTEYCYLLGRREDMPRLMAAVDVIVSSSQSEGFPNVIAEGMACGTPCVATAAGDSAEIIGDTGKIVPICNPERLAQECLAVLRMSAEARERLGNAARERIQTLYSLPAIAQQYEQLYQELLTHKIGAN